MIGVISDIHGNFPALKAVIGELERLCATEIYSLGDIVGYYCMPNECVELLRSKNIKNILGNHDDYLVNNKLCGRSNSVDQAIAYQRGILTEENFHWLAASGDSFSEPLFLAVHGGVHDHLDEYVDAFQFPQGVLQNIFFTGHTHRQALEKKDEKVWCNPGAVGQPRDGDPRAAFVLLSPDGDILLRRVPYDIGAIATAMRDAGFDEYFYKGLYLGKAIGNQ